jgi:hypothetical protein
MLHRYNAKSRNAAVHWDHQLHGSGLFGSPRGGQPLLTPAQPAPVEPATSALGSGALGHRFDQLAVLAPSPVGIQPKLTINAPGDRFERQADQIAERIMHSWSFPPEPLRPQSLETHESLQRKAGNRCACGGLVTSGGECEACRAKRLGLKLKSLSGLHRSSTEASGPPPAAGEAIATALRGSGAPLPTSERAFFERRLGHDLSAVRVHTGATAAMAAREIQAKAFTYGHDVFFDGAHWAPGTGDGRRLLGHELVHVIQQTGESGVTNGRSDRPVQRETGPTIQRQACEELDDSARGGLPQMIEAYGGGAPEVPQVEAERLTFEQFEAMTGVRGDQLPDNTFVGMDHLQAGTQAQGPDLTGGLAPAGAAAVFGLTPQVPISLTPANSVGILVTRPHVSIFARVDGQLTVVGFRGNIFTHAGSQLPGEAGMWFKQQLIDGVPGRVRGDSLFTLMGEQAVIYRETDGSTARRFASHLENMRSGSKAGGRYGGEYRFSPPDPSAPPGSTESKLAERTYRAQGETKAVMKGARNCITVPMREIHFVLGTSPTVGGVDLTTGRTQSGEYRRYQHGRARMMWDYGQNPDLSKGKPGLSSVTITPSAARAVGVIRVGGGIMLIYGGIVTGKRLRDAWGTDDFPVVAAQETLTMTGGILGTAAGAAATSAVVCAPSGPITLLCAVGGFLGGLAVGTLGAIAGSMIIPVLVRIIEGTMEAMLLLMEGFATAGEIIRGISGSFTDMLFTNLFKIRYSLNHCNWELQGLTPQAQGDINALGLQLWSQFGAANADTTLDLIGRPVKSFGVPYELLEAIAEGVSKSVQARTGLDFIVTPEYLGGLHPPDFVNQLELYGLLQYKYDPTLLAEIQMLPGG